MCDCPKLTGALMGVAVTSDGYPAFPGGGGVAVESISVLASSYSGPSINQVGTEAPLTVIDCREAREALQPPPPQYVAYVL